MDPERWQQVNALLDEALDLPPGRRQAYIDAHCRQDPELRREVASLLEAHNEANSFLEAPVKDYAATLLSMAKDRVADPLIGKQIDDYRVLGVLGRGGMGIVYKAEDEALSRMVALKMIDPGLARDESFVRRFRAEARALARIDSRHIVRVHAMRQTSAGLYIVMEYVDGGTLTDRLQGGPLAWGSARSIVDQMLMALEHAHSVGVIHRDIKPSNIMLSTSGVVKVADFGLAKVRQADRSATVTQGIAGTLFYMSPEQVRGRGDLDHRSDLYSMGMTIYQMLAGRLPFDRDDGEFKIMRSIVETSFPPPTHYQPDIPKAVSDAVMKAIEKEPDRRFQDAAEMRAAFSSAGSGYVGAEAPTIVDTAPYQPAGASKKGMKMPSRRTMMLGGLGTLIIVLVVAGGILVYQLIKGKPTPPDDDLEPAFVESALSVSTVPSGVRVLVGDSLIGQTPLNEAAVPVRDGRLRLSFEKEGYDSRDTTFIGVAPNEPVSLRAFRLREAAPDVVSVRVTSSPPGATVRINNEIAGTTGTPEMNNLRLPANQGFVVEVRKDGCQSWSRRYESPPASIDAPLTCSSGPSTDTDPQPPARGTLTLNVEPSGSVQVEGASCQAGTPCQVPAGTQTVRFTHPNYDTQTRTVAVQGDEQVQRTFYFEQPVAIQVRHADAPGDPNRAPWASIYVDGEKIDETSVKRVSLGPGQHRITVSRTGYTVETPPQTITIEPGFEQRELQPVVFLIRPQ